MGAEENPRPVSIFIQRTLLPAYTSHPLTHPTRTHARTHTHTRTHARNSTRLFHVVFPTPTLYLLTYM